MFSVSVLLMLLLCLQCGRLCHALHAVQTLSLEVEYGASAILPCNGSAYLEEEGSVQWEAIGQDVAILRGGDLQQGDKYTGRVLVPSEEQLREGDWSVVLQHTVFSDSDMYECIWQGRKTIATVWLTVTVPQVAHSVMVSVGDTVGLPCYVHISRSWSLDHLQLWWTRNGNTVVSTEKEALSSDSEDMSRISLVSESRNAFHLHMSPTMLSDTGEYQCWYKTRDLDDPTRPESITLTVLEIKSTDTVFHPDETTTAPEDMLSETDWTVAVTVLLEDPTQPMKVTTEWQPMEAFEETLTLFPGEETLTESLLWDTVPWVRIGLIGGVLLVTAVVLCILKALQRI